MPRERCFETSRGLAARLALLVQFMKRLSASPSSFLLTLALGLLLLTCLSCGGSALKASTPEYDRPIGTVEIRGNKALSDDEIVDGLVNQGPSGFWFFKKWRTFEPAEVARDAERIQGVYRQHGYFDAQVVDIAIERKGKVDLVFNVDEGQPILLDKVEIDWLKTPEGTYADSTQKLKEEIKNETLVFQCCESHTRKGDVLDHVDYLDAKARLRSFFMHQGYAHAKIDGRLVVNRRKNSADVFFEVDPGPKVRMGKTRITGLSLIPVSVVQNRIKWSEGDLYDPDDIAVTRGRLLRLGRFSKVAFETDNDERREIADVHIELREERLREIRLGGGAAADPAQFEIRARAEYTKSNVFLDPLTSLRARFQPAYRWLRSSTDRLGLGGEALVSLERIDAVFPLVTAETDLAYGIERFESYETRGPRTRFSVRRPFFGEQLYVGMAWNLALASFPKLSPAISENPELAAQLGVDGNYRVAYYEQTLALDLRDDAVDPRKGIYLGARLEEGTRYAGGRYAYLRGQADLRGYYPLGKRIVLAGRVRHTQLLSGDSLPLTRRLYAGGASSQRGFAQRQLSPVRIHSDEDGDVASALVGGNLRFESSAEVRWDVKEMLGDWLGLVGFVDAADVTEDVQDFDPASLHYAAGLGLRLGTIVGPVRADFGYRLNRVGQGEPAPNDNFAFHVSIGEAF